ncbi:MAG TPA: hypothetical protein VK974_06840 [Methylophilaceae bacterium]|nr:hypothetical protein [Methylophilaceae bacterium]
MKSLFEKLRPKQAKDKSAINLDWLAELDNVDDLTALEKTTLFLSGFISDQSMPEADTRRLEALFIIDERNYQRIEKSFAQYVRFDNLRPELDQRISEAIYYYYRQLFLNYNKQVEVMLELTDALRLHYQAFPLALGRAMHAAFAMIKLRYYSRQPTSNAAWLQVFKLFSIAEQEALPDAPLKIYLDLNAITPSTSLVQACMLDSINKSNMNRHQIDLAANIIKTLIPEIKTSQSYNEKRHLYFIDLMQDKGAQRVRQVQLTPSCRFWETDELSIKIDLFIHYIKSKKSLEPFALGSIATNPHLLEMLTYLQSEWSRSEHRKQRRKEDRKSTNRVATVTYGIESVTNQIKQILNKKIPSGKSFEERLSSHSVDNRSHNVLMPYASGERWIVIDESSKGLGAEVGKEHCMSIKPDKLASAIFTDPNDMEIIGVIRSVIELAKNRRHIGIEILSRQAALVQIIKLDADSPVASDDTTRLSESILGVSGLYLPVEEGLSDSASIIMPRINFLENNTYQISSASKKSIVRFGSAVELKDDWARVNVDVKL